MKIEKITLRTNDGLLFGDVYHSSKEEKAKVICVHGGGLQGRESFVAIRTALAPEGVTSYAFDFVGHGETGGDTSSSSLEKRVNQITEILKNLNFPHPVTLIASSMGGYIALKVSEIYPIDTLIMFAPAVYTKDVFSVPFGDTFSSMIRSPLSWEKTDAWSSMSSFTGNILLLEAEKDQIIPAGVIERLYTSACLTKNKKHIVFKEATHSLTRWISEHPQDLKVTVAEIVNCIHQ